MFEGSGDSRWDEWRDPYLHRAVNRLALGVGSVQTAVAYYGKDAGNRQEATATIVAIGAITCWIVGEFSIAAALAITWLTVRWVTAEAPNKES